MRGLHAVRTAVAAMLCLALGPAFAPPASADPFPEVIPLPDGFAPEGVAAGRGATFFVGSLANGAIYRGDLRTGTGTVLVDSAASEAVGLEVDGRNRVWVAGGSGAAGRVYHGGTGALLSEHALPGAGFVNDVVVTRDAAYFTDSFAPVLHVVPIGPDGALGAASTLPLGGEWVQAGGFNANGIEASPDGRTLLVANTQQAALYAVDAATGVATLVDLGGAALPNGDGILRQGRTLYVTQNFLNQVAVVRLARGYESARILRTVTDPDLDVPTTVALWGSSLYAVNARFTTPPSPTTDYDVVRLPRR